MNTPKVGNAPCSWGTLEFEGMSGAGPDFRQVLDEMADTGYDGTELGDWGFMPTDPVTLREELSARGLFLLGAFVPVAFRDPQALEAGRDIALRTARLLAETTRESNNTPCLVLADANGTDPVRTQTAGRIPPEMGLSDSEWAIFARGVETVAREVSRETGLVTVFHHHCAGFVETPGEIAVLLDRTDPSLVHLLLDTGHCAMGAGSASAIFDVVDRYESRIAAIHFKDWHPATAWEVFREGGDYFEALRRGVFCELGKGDIDFPRILEWIRRRGVPRWVVVEQDVLPGMGAPKESARRNREYLRGIGCE